MDLVSARLLTEDVAAITRFYGTVLGTDVVVNDYYVELATGAATLAFCRRRFTETDGCGAHPPVSAADRVILDFEVADVDAVYQRLAPVGGITWLLPPTDQPWGTRSALFRDPDGNLVNLFSRPLPGGRG